MNADAARSWTSLKEAPGRGGEGEHRAGQAIDRALIAILRAPRPRRGVPASPRRSWCARSPASWMRVRRIQFHSRPDARRHHRDERLQSQDRRGSRSSVVRSSTTFSCGRDQPCAAKTQSALLQAMQERTVTIDRETHRLSDGFTVFPPRYPIEYEGRTAAGGAEGPLIMLKIAIGCPNATRSWRWPGGRCRTSLPRGRSGRQGCGRSSAPGSWRAAQVARDAHRARGSPGLRRGHREASASTNRFSFGAGRRATQALLLQPRARPLDGRDFVTPDDIRDDGLRCLEPGSSCVDEIRGARAGGGHRPDPAGRGGAR